MPWGTYLLRYEKSHAVSRAYARARPGCDESHPRLTGCGALQRLLHLHTLLLLVVEGVELAHVLPLKLEVAFYEI